MKFNHARLGLSLFFLLMFAGCVSQPIAPISQFSLQVPAEMAYPGSEFGDDATVYILRSPGLNRTDSELWAQIDRVTQVTLERQTWSKLRVPAGRRELAYVWANGAAPNIAVCINFAPATTYYLLYTPSVSYIPKGKARAEMDFSYIFHGEVEFIAQAEATERITKYKIMDALNPALSKIGRCF